MQAPFDASDRATASDRAWAQINHATALLGGGPAGPRMAADAAAARDVFRAIDLRAIDVPPSNQDVSDLLTGYRTLAGRLGIR